MRHRGPAPRKQLRHRLAIAMAARAFRNSARVRRASTSSTRPRHLCTRGPHDLRPDIRQARHASCSARPDLCASSRISSASVPYTSRAALFARSIGCRFQIAMDLADSCVVHCPVAQPAQRNGMVHAVLGHVAIRRPLSAGNRQQAGCIHVNDVIAREGRSLLPSPFTSGRSPT